MKLKLIKTTSSTKNTQLKVSDEVFDKPNPALLAQAIRIYLSNKRQGTSKVKTRGEVSRTTKKWYKQKGTGGARHGAKDANIFVGGGVSHGPTGMENWKKKITKKFRQSSLAASLTAQSSNIFVNDEIEGLLGKTKEAVELLQKISSKFADERFKLSESKLLIIMDQIPEKARRGIKNIPNVTILSARLINALAVAKAHKIVITTQAVKELETRVTA